MHIPEIFRRPESLPTVCTDGFSSFVGLCDYASDAYPGHLAEHALTKGLIPADGRLAPDPNARTETTTKLMIRERGPIERATRPQAPALLDA